MLGRAQCLRYRLVGAEVVRFTFRHDPIGGGALADLGSHGIDVVTRIDVPLRHPNLMSATGT